MSTHTRAALVHQAFQDAITDRLQAAADNMTCAPEHAADLQAQVSQWKQIKPFILPEPAALQRLTLHDIRSLSAPHFSGLCDVLYFAAVFRLSLIEAHEHTRTSIAADQTLRRRYLSLLRKISDPARSGASLQVADPRDVIALVPEGDWEIDPDGGRVFRPKLPSIL